MKFRIYASAVAAILAGCGGSGDDSPGVTVVSGNPPAPVPAQPPPPTAGPPTPVNAPPPTAGPPTPVNPPPAPAPVVVVVVTPPPPAEANLPPDAPPVNEPVEGPVAPPPDQPAPPPPPPAAQILTIPGASLVNALRTSKYARSMTSATPADNFFSEAEIGFAGASFTHRSSFIALETPFGGTSKPPLPRKQTDMTLNVAVSPDALSFAGTGSISFEGTPYSLQGPQYAVPAQVPLNTPGLVEWKVPGTDYWVRFNVGGVTGQPEQFRACFDIFLGGLDRVSCTHHQREDGTPVGADAIERIAGVETVHETNDEAESPRRVLFCDFKESGRLVPPGTESFSYSLFQFKHPYLYQNRSLILVLNPSGGVTTYVQTDLGGGLIQEDVGPPRGTYTFTHRGNAIESWEQTFGFVDYGFKKSCQTF
jgi:hypothetical protein